MRVENSTTGHSASSIATSNMSYICNLPREGGTEMKTSLQMLSRRTEIWHIPADSSVGMQDATPCPHGGDVRRFVSAIHNEWPFARLLAKLKVQDGSLLKGCYLLILILQAGRKRQQPLIKEPERCHFRWVSLGIRNRLIRIKVYEIKRERSA